MKIIEMHRYMLRFLLFLDETKKVKVAGEIPIVAQTTRTDERLIKTVVHLSNYQTTR